MFRLHVEYVTLHMLPLSRAWPEVLAMGAVTISCILSAFPPTYSEDAASVLEAIPSVAFVLQLWGLTFWAYAAVFVLVVLAMDSYPHEVIVLTLSFVASCHMVDRRSLLIHVASAGTAMIAIVWMERARGGDQSLPTTAAVLSLELAAWAMERHLLPWIVPSKPRGAVRSAFTFLLSLVTGVHFPDASKDPNFLCRPSREREGGHHLVVGVSVLHDRAYLRYRGTLAGWVLAYVEGLALVPVRLRRDTTTDGRTFKVSILCFDGVATVDVSEWEPMRISMTTCAAARFPYRRVLQGLLLRFPT